MKRILIVAIALVMAFTLTACGSKSNDGFNTNSNTGKNTSGDEAVSNSSAARIKLIFKNEEVIAKMYDNSTSRDFLTLLPVTIKLEDYAEEEKISYLPRKLSTKDALSGSDPAVGDFAYFSPWGNLAIFYKDHGYANGLIVLGKIESGTEKLANLISNTTVRIERIE